MATAPPRRYTPWVGSPGTVATVDPGVDVVAPSLVSAVVPTDGLTLALTYNEALNAASAPSAGAFALGGTVRTVSSAAVLGAVVTLTLSGAIAQGATVTVTYTPGGSPIEDIAGNEAAAFVAQAVTNGSTVGGADVTWPTLSSAVVAADGLSIELTYNETLYQLSVPAVGAFVLAGVPATVVNVSIVGAVVTLALGLSILSGDTVTLRYTPGANPIQDAAGNEAAAFVAQAVTNSSAVSIPLGRAAWSLWADARDYANLMASGATVTAALTPQVGSGVLTPANSPTVVSGAQGIGQRLAFKHTAASNHSFSAHWLATAMSMSGVKKPATIVLRAQRGAAAGAVWAGFGKASSATNSFLEAAIQSGGQAIARRHDGTTAATKAGTVNLASTPHSVVVTTDGNTMYLYVDGVLDPNFTTPLGTTGLTASVVLDQFRIGNSGRLVGGGGLDGAWQVCGVSAGVVDATQVAAIHAALLAGDIPAPAGAQVYFVGDSLFAYSGVSARQKLAEMATAAGKNIAMVGAFSSGAFANNRHSAQNGVEIASIRSRALSELGAGKAFPNVRLVCLLGAVNDLNNPGVVLADVQAAYTAAVTDIHAAITATVPTARIAVYTTPPLQPGTTGDTNVNAFNAWLRGTLKPTWDAGHVGSELFLVDVEQALGSWSAPNYLDSTHPNGTGWTAVHNAATVGQAAVLSSYINAIG